MVYGRDDIEFEFAARSRLEDPRINFYLFDAGTVEFFESCYDARLLACARGAIDEKMGKVTALSLGREVSIEVGFGEAIKGRTSERRRSERSSWYVN